MDNIYSLQHLQNNQHNNQNEVVTTRMSDITMIPISWLWPNYIACGKITVIAGNPGLGKSQITASLAAIITRGKIWPVTGEPCPIGNVVFISCEDDPADTINPRLVAAGADIERCHVVDAVKIYKENHSTTERLIDLSQDIIPIFNAIEKIGDVRLLVIDPVSAYFGKSDSNSNTEVRGMLAPLAEMAAKMGIAVVLLTHLNKNENQDVMGRFIGSIGLIAAARAGFVVIKDSNNPEIRHFLPVKNNIGEDNKGFSYTIEGIELSEGIKTSRICWHLQLVDAHSLLNPQAKAKNSQNAVTFLEDLLADKPMAANDIFEAAEANGYSKGQIRTAKKKLDIKIEKTGMDGGWQWSIRQYFDNAKDYEDAEDTTI